MHCDERGCPGVSPPPSEPLPHNCAFTSLNEPDPERIRTHFLSGGFLSVEDAREIICRVISILKEEPNVLPLRSPITVVGDIHGQYFDLQSVFEMGGDPLHQQYLFLGDYVDRGCFSTEVTLYIFTLKILRPQFMWLLRGNHECRHLTTYFNFRNECLTKYDEETYELFLASFCALPLAAVLDTCFFCVHGGLSPLITSIDDVSLIDRFSEPLPGNAMCDLLWADPMEEDEEQFCQNALFLYNELRGCSCVFSFAAVEHFLVRNDLLSIIRAHEAQNEGFRMLRKNRDNGFPSMISLFSAPNYCDTFGNKGAVMCFDGKQIHIQQFNCVSHPYCLPDFLDAFKWSLPFMCDRIHDAVELMIHPSTGSSAGSSDSDDEWGGVLVALPIRGRRFKAKIHCNYIQRRGRTVRTKVIACARFCQILRRIRAAKGQQKRSSST